MRSIGLQHCLNGHGPKMDRIRKKREEIFSRAFNIHCTHSKCTPTILTKQNGNSARISKFGILFSQVFETATTKMPTKLFLSPLNERCILLKRCKYFAVFFCYRMPVYGVLFVLRPLKMGKFDTITVAKWEKNANIIRHFEHVALFCCVLFSSFYRISFAIFFHSQFR